ncbi:MAG: SPOR domain-containing protein [Desulfobacteraceae bacterium]|nr:SPOR domain-containing protein [Desulfobacteraceae bacterium]
MGSTRSKNARNASGGSVSGWLALIFTASACMFILGVLVGRNTAPVHFDMENLDKKISQLEESVVAGISEQPGRSAPEDIPDEVAFEFYDKLKEEEEIDEHAAGRPRVLTAKYNKPPPSEMQVEAAEGEKTEKDETTEKDEKAREPAPPRRQALEKEYAIQVASLRNIERAEKVREKFRAKGYPAFTQVTVVEGKGRYCRVRLGPYKNRTQAQNDLNRLQKAGVDAMLFLNSDF